MDVVLFIARLLLAAVFIVAGFAKLADLPGSRQALRDFGVPAVLANPSGVLLPLAEIARGCGAHSLGLRLVGSHRGLGPAAPLRCWN